jgi:hypothetical protein
VVDVMGVGVWAALFQTIMHRVQTGVVAFFAGMDALVHFRRLMFMDVIHIFSFSFLFLALGLPKRSSLRFEIGLVSCDWFIWLSP